jgi:hypothetical protein
MNPSSKIEWDRILPLPAWNFSQKKHAKIMIIRPEYTRTMATP